MSELTLKNQLGDTITVWDSYADKDADQNYFGTLTKLTEVGAGDTVKVAAPHALSTLIVFDKDQKPVTRWTAGLGKTSFTASQADLNTMAEANAFVEEAARDPSSAEAKGIAGLKTAKDIDAFFKTLPRYAKVTAPVYMTALTYRAAHPATVGALPPAPPEQTYSLSQLLPVLTGVAYPAGMPDITVSHLFFHDEDGRIRIGGKVTLSDIPFDPSLTGIALKLIEAAGPVNVEIDIDTEVGLNFLGTKLRFWYKKIDIPLGDDAKLVIDKPHVVLTINPAFKFVILQVGADFPFTLFGETYATKLSMVLDNIEIEVGFDLDFSKTALPSLPTLQGVHFDNFGFGMGVMFEPPGYALGVEGKLRIGEGASDVSLYDDTFALILDLEGDVPNPVYLAFYVQRLDLPTLLTAFTDQTVTIDIPAEFSDLSFHWCENPLEPLALPDGTLAQGGYGFSGQLDLFGLRFFADVDIALDHIKADAVMAPLNLGGILGLTGKGKAMTRKYDAKGNPIRNNFVPKTAADRTAIANATTREVVAAGGPELHVSTEAEPYFQADATVTLFGVVFETVDIKIDSSCMSFHLKMPFSDVTVTITEAGGFKGAFSYGPDFKIPLPSPLGSIHLQATIDLLIGLKTQGHVLDFSAGGGFSFMGETLHFGPVDLTINIGGLEAIAQACENYIANNCIQIFSTLLADAAAWAKAAFDGVVKGVDNIASGLKDFFNHTADEVAQVLASIGMNPMKAASQIKDAFSGITATALSVALTGPFGLTAAAAAPILKAVGFTPEGIASALHSAFGLNAEGTAKLLGDIGEPVENIGRVISDVFTLSPNIVADVLKSVGFPAKVIADAFKAIGGPFTSVGDAISGALETVISKLDPTHW